MRINLNRIKKFNEQNVLHIFTQRNSYGFWYIKD